MLRNVGASLAVVGASVGAWGVLAVTNGSATANAPDCTSSPPSIACLHDNAGFEGVTAAQFGSSCNFEAQGTTTDGFHFILPQSQGSTFSSITAYFDENGALVTVTMSSGFTQSGTGAVMDVPNGAILLEATATITGGDSSATAGDGGDPFFVLSGTCAGTGGSTTTTTTTTPTTTITTPTTTATTTAETTRTTRTTTTTTTTRPTTTATETTTETTTTPTTTSTTTTPTTTTTETTTTPTTTSTTTTPTTTSTTTTPTTTTTTPASTTTTASGTGGSSGATTSAATTTQGAGLGAGSGAGGVQAAGITSPNTGAAAEGPFGIGVGLALAGLAMLGFSYRRREKAK